MGVPALDNLVRIGTLKAEPCNQAEFDGLLAAGAAKLKDAAYSGLSAESRFDLAYNAAHALSLAALRWHGYRSEKRFTAFQALEHTIGLPSASWRVLDKAHRDRNLAEYEGVFDVDDILIRDIVRITGEVLLRVRALGPVRRVTP
jgi:hypothetical protein